MHEADISEGAPDPYSDILRLAGVRASIAGGFTAGGPWAVRFPQPATLRYFAIVKGRGLFIEEGEAPLMLEEGDVLLLVRARSFVLASDTGAPPKAAAELFGTPAPHTGTWRLGEREEFSQIGAHVELDAANADLITDALPRLLHVRAQDASALRLRWLIGELVHERRQPGPGSALMATHFAQLVFLHLLRLHADRAEALPPGWLRAAGDRRLTGVLRLMHARPAHPWSLAELASAAQMPRTRFATHFRAAAGQTPLGYLAAWRMRLARKALRDESTPVSALALSLGYGSESAFSNAFKRLHGVAPRRYRSGQQNPPRPLVHADPC